MKGSVNKILSKENLTINQIVAVSNYSFQGNSNGADGFGGALLPGNTVKVFYSAFKKDADRKEVQSFYSRSLVGGDDFAAHRFEEEGFVKLASLCPNGLAEPQMWLNLKNVDFIRAMDVQDRHLHGFSSLGGNNLPGVVIGSYVGASLNWCAEVAAVPLIDVTGAKEAIKAADVSFSHVFSDWGEALYNDRLFVADDVFKKSLENSGLAFADVLAVSTSWPQKLAEDMAPGEGVVAYTLKGEKVLRSVAPRDFLKRGFVGLPSRAAARIKAFDPRRVDALLEVSHHFKKDVLKLPVDKRQGRVVALTWNASLDPQIVPDKKVSSFVGISFLTAKKVFERADLPFAPVVDERGPMLVNKAALKPGCTFG